MNNLYLLAKTNLVNACKFCERRGQPVSIWATDSEHITLDMLPNLSMVKTQPDRAILIRDTAELRQAIKLGKRYAIVADVSVGCSHECSHEGTAVGEWD